MLCQDLAKPTDPRDAPIIHREMGWPWKADNGCLVVSSIVGVWLQQSLSVTPDLYLRDLDHSTMYTCFILFLSHVIHAEESTNMFLLLLLQALSQ